MKSDHDVPKWAWNAAIEFSHLARGHEAEVEKAVYEWVSFERQRRCAATAGLPEISPSDIANTVSEDAKTFATWAALDDGAASRAAMDLPLPVEVMEARSIARLASLANCVSQLWPSRDAVEESRLATGPELDGLEGVTFTLLAYPFEKTAIVCALRWLRTRWRGERDEELAAKSTPQGDGDLKDPPDMADTDRADGPKTTEQASGVAGGVGKDAGRVGKPNGKVNDYASPAERLCDLLKLIEGEKERETGIAQAVFAMRAAAIRANKKVDRKKAAGILGLQGGVKEYNCYNQFVTRKVGSMATQSGEKPNEADENTLMRAGKQWFDIDRCVRTLGESFMRQSRTNCESESPRRIHIGQHR